MLQKSFTTKEENTIDINIEAVEILKDWTWSNKNKKDREDGREIL